MSVPHDGDHVVHLAPEQLAQGGPGGEGAITRQACTEENKPGLGGFTHLESLSKLMLLLYISGKYFESTL